MGRPPNTIELESLTVRYPPGVGQFLRNEMVRLTKTKGRQFSLNDVIREMIETFRSMFGLPQQVVDVPEQDRQKRKMDMHPVPLAFALRALRAAPPRKEVALRRRRTGLPSPVQNAESAAAIWRALSFSRRAMENGAPFSANGVRGRCCSHRGQNASPLTTQN